ncbi:unnamed protein product [Vitrella brassicaformis CCMP3155]|uniref:Uncharacterized protein n=1 Tax=Vitrella brassicaformis (strain CCMP3155) TaxID=1169540 RepID=A0A0G4EJK8_VITBC|nr:unnamed protein product [Vitrella brassicaformis CCMP3155]|eukprot:CEL96721.1 unnamed protein product [Vitrella brassicaformis CCMP3155]
MSAKKTSKKPSPRKGGVSSPRVFHRGWSRVRDAVFGAVTDDERKTSLDFLLESRRRQRQQAYRRAGPARAAPLTKAMGLLGFIPTDMSMQELNEAGIAADEWLKRVHNKLQAGGMPSALNYPCPTDWKGLRGPIPRSFYEVQHPVAHVVEPKVDGEAATFKLVFQWLLKRLCDQQRKIDVLWELFSVRDDLVESNDTRTGQQSAPVDSSQVSAQQQEGSLGEISFTLSESIEQPVASHGSATTGPDLVARGQCILLRNVVHSFHESLQGLQSQLRVTNTRMDKASFPQLEAPKHVRHKDVQTMPEDEGEEPPDAARLLSKPPWSLPLLKTLDIYSINERFTDIQKDQHEMCRALTAHQHTIFELADQAKDYTETKDMIKRLQARQNATDETIKAMKAEIKSFSALQQRIEETQLDVAKLRSELSERKEDLEPVAEKATKLAKQLDTVLDRLQDVETDIVKKGDVSNMQKKLDHRISRFKTAAEETFGLLDKKVIELYECFSNAFGDTTTPLILQKPVKTHLHTDTPQSVRTPSPPDSGRITAHRPISGGVDVRRSPVDPTLTTVCASCLRSFDPTPLQPSPSICKPLPSNFGIIATPNFLHPPKRGESQRGTSRKHEDDSEQPSETEMLRPKSQPAGMSPRSFHRIATPDLRCGGMAESGAESDQSIPLAPPPPPPSSLPPQPLSPPKALAAAFINENHCAKSPRALRAKRPNNRKATWQGKKGGMPSVPPKHGSTLDGHHASFEMSSLERSIDTFTIDGFHSSDGRGAAKGGPKGNGKRNR